MLRRVVRFILLFIVIEALLTVSLIVFYLWVERDVCPVAFKASGHCYADWFSMFEAVFYPGALLLCIAPFFALLYHFNRVKRVR